MEVVVAASRSLVVHWLEAGRTWSAMVATPGTTMVVVVPISTLTLVTCRASLSKASATALVSIVVTLVVIATTLVVPVGAMVVVPVVALALIIVVVPVVVVVVAPTSIVTILSLLLPLVTGFNKGFHFDIRGTIIIILVLKGGLGTFRSTRLGAVGIFGGLGHFDLVFGALLCWDLATHGEGQRRRFGNAL